MDHNAVKLVQESWRRVEAIGPEAAELFHGNLLDRRSWLTAQYQGYVDDRNLMVLETFGHAIKGMHALDTHASVLLQIGRVNAHCGVQTDHYPCFKVALLQTLESLLGDTFSGALKEAWMAVIGTMVRLMLAGADSGQLVTIAIRQQGVDRRSQHRRAAHALGGNRGQHRRAGHNTNRRMYRAPTIHRAVQLGG
jgi:hemoglobin-like flavoprotein